MKQTEILTHATHVNGWFPAVYMSCMSQNFRLFHYRIYPLETFEFFCSCIWDHCVHTVVCDSLGRHEAMVRFKIDIIRADQLIGCVGTRVLIDIPPLNRSVCEVIIWCTVPGRYLLPKCCSRVQSATKLRFVINIF